MANAITAKIKARSRLTTSENTGADVLPIVRIHLIGFLLFIIMNFAIYYGFL